MELLKPLKAEHLPELTTRTAMLNWLQAEAHEVEIQSNRAGYIYNCLQEGWVACLQRGISLDKPQDLQAYVQTMEPWMQAYQEAMQRHALLLKTCEAFQEALTLWLAEHYEFSPLKDHYELDLENRVLRKAARVPEPTAETSLDKANT